MGDILFICEYQRWPDFAGCQRKHRRGRFSKRFEITGVRNADKVIKDFWNTLNSAKVSTSILVDADVTSIDYDGKTLVCVHVPQATYKQRPVYINENPIKGTFKRNHDGDYHCTEDEVKAMLRDASDTGNDGGLLEGYTMDDIDEDSLKAYRIEFDTKIQDMCGVILKIRSSCENWAV